MDNSSGVPLSRIIIVSGEEPKSQLPLAGQGLKLGLAEVEAEIGGVSDVNKIPGSKRSAGAVSGNLDFAGADETHGLLLLFNIARPIRA